MGMKNERTRALMALLIHFYDDANVNHILLSPTRVTELVTFYENDW